MPRKARIKPLIGVKPDTDAVQLKALVERTLRQAGRNHQADKFKRQSRDLWTLAGVSQLAAYYVELRHLK